MLANRHNTGKTIEKDGKLLGKRGRPEKDYDVQEIIHGVSIAGSINKYAKSSDIRRNTVYEIAQSHSREIEYLTEVYAGTTDNKFRAEPASEA